LRVKIGVYVRSISRFTPFYMTLIDPAPPVEGGNVFVPAYDQSAVTAFALRAE
jgi:hypothetical protein